ncbi:DUF3575 domain-containing protein [Winogradskyella ursingii]|uniref:DUF3575 domain-containing protein n=1 Tax=Winogradskyella ursingii TaxID=2686079 RepID=UPI0015CD2962|nr:DUF3575 domain-containing protein [Winogradskyella ursingii]
MKNIVLAIVLLFSIFTLQSQNQNDTIVDPHEKDNEVKINAVFLLAGAFEGFYERNINEESSAGISVFLPFANDIDYDINYYVSPYYRIFFGNKYAAGFFLEGFAMLNSVEREFSSGSNGNLTFEDKTVTDFALGFGLGSKWLTTGGFVFELSGGIGRNLFENDFDGESLVGKFGFNLGYRF